MGMRRTTLAVLLAGILVAGGGGYYAWQHWQGAASSGIAAGAGAARQPAAVPVTLATVQKTPFPVYQNGLGTVLSAQESWLLMRGMKTLQARMEHSERSARRLAEWLSGHKEVSAVYYPGLEGHPGRAVHEKQSLGYGAVPPADQAATQQYASQPYGTQPYGGTQAYGAQPYGAQPYGAATGTLPPGAPGAGPEPSGPNVLGIVALVVAAVGFVFACIPFVQVVGWILLPIAFVLSIVALLIGLKAYWR